MVNGSFATRRFDGRNAGLAGRSRHSPRWQREKSVDGLADLERFSREREPNADGAR